MREGGRRSDGGRGHMQACMNRIYVINCDIEFFCQ